VFLVRQTFLSFAGATESPAGEQLTLQQQLQKRKKMTVDDVFNNDDDEVMASKKRKLVPLDYTDEERAAISGRMAPVAPAASAEEKRKSIKNLIERIPTAKDDLFAYPLDWSMVDAVRFSEALFSGLLKHSGVWGNVIDSEENTWHNNQRHEHHIVEVEYMRLEAIITTLLLIGRLTLCMPCI
jgi:hypothetical protein